MTRDARSQLGRGCIVPFLAGIFLTMATPAGTGVTHAAGPREIFASPQGDDGQPGTKERPFATVGRAVKAVRDLRPAASPGGPVTVYLRGGTYAQAEKLVFGPDDTGSKDSPITYMSYPGERAVISGGRRIQGPWRKSAGRECFETLVPQAQDGKWTFNSLYVNGTSRMRARKPNWGEKELRAEGRAPGEDERQAFIYFPGDISPAWTDLNNVDIVLLCSWTPTLHKITEVTPDRRVVKFVSSHGRSVDFWERNFRYYVANVFEELDAPGEWYLNRKTGMLYYYPLPGEDMATAEVIAPVVMTRLVELVGDVAAGRFIEHLRFRDLDLRHSDGDLARYNGMYRQGHMFLGAAIYAEGLRSSEFLNCEIAQVGEYALELAAGCRDNHVEHCHIWDTGAGAMQIGITDLPSVLAEFDRITPGDIVIEAEDAAVTAPMRIESQGGYVALPVGSRDGQAAFSVPLDQDGRYRVLAGVFAPSGNANSFFVQVNDGPRYTYDTGVRAEWFISPVTARELEGKPIIAELKKGMNTVVVAGREAGTKLDRLILRPERKGAPSETDRSQNSVQSNTVANNCIHRLGALWHGCYGIVNRFASHTKILHNDISDTFWIPIGLDARWSYHGEDYSHGNEVAYNHLHHLGLRYNTDAGGIYQFGPLDTHIHHNHIHDTCANPYWCGFTGIYLDEQSRGAVVENNLVYNVEWSAFLQNRGTNNTFRNNIGAFARDGFIHRGGLGPQGTANTFEACRNIYIAGDEVAIRTAWSPGPAPPILRGNLYFSTTGRTDLTFAGKSLAEWQAQGYDKDSVIADPGCAGPKNLDFALSPDATAVKELGFVPFDKEIRTAGLYGDTAWVALPGKYPRRTPTKVWTPEDMRRLVAFRLDFEDMPDGWEPPVFRLAKEGPATFAVTSETACTGKKSYKCVDRRGMKKVFYPYIHIAPRKLDTARITFSFDAMIPKDSAAPFWVEFRGRGPGTSVGPSLRFNADGALLADGRRLLPAGPGTWRHVAISFALGEGARKEYTLLARCEGVEKRETLPFKHPTFDEVGWLGISAADDADGVFYLDNLELKIE